MGRKASHVFAAHQYLPGAWLVEAGDDIDKGRLACAVRPDKRVDCAWLDGEGNILQGRNAGVVFGKPFDTKIARARAANFVRRDIVLDLLICPTATECAAEETNHTLREQQQDADKNGAVYYGP